LKKRLAPGFERRAEIERWVCVPLILLSSMTLMPNKTLEPTAGSAGSSAARATRLVRLWLSFGR
jgi:hypothetical protein